MRNDHSRDRAEPHQRAGGKDHTMNIPRPHVDGRAFRGHRKSAKKALAGVSSLLLAVTLLPIGLLTPAQSAQINVGQGFSITPSDLKFILAQIKIAENHVANTTTATGPCGALVGTGPNQIPSPLVSKGLRTVDGSCNNLQDGQETFGAADQVFPRIGGKDFRPAEANPPLFGPPNPSSYADKTPNNVVFDSQPRVISNLIVDQTSSNPAAIAAAGEPVRSQGGDPVVPCQTPAGARPDHRTFPFPASQAHKTLFIPNVTTDVGLSPPYNSLFTIFGQFFDHGVDQTVKGGGTVFVPLKDDDPLVAGDDHDFGTGCNDPATATAACADNLPANLRFMPLTRGKNQAGEDGILGTTDDVQDAVNTDSPWVDQSQTYTSHSSHQAFLREYNLVGGVPVATGKLLGGRLDATGAPVLAAVGEDQGISTWAAVKAQARLRLGLLLTDADVENIPMLVTDPYGNFIPGPVRGLPQYMTATGPVEGNRTTPVAPPANVLHFETPFLTDIAHSAVPKRTAGGALFPDTDLVAGESLDTTVPAGTYDDELLDSHFSCGDGRCNENIALSAVHQIFHSEHDRLVDDITTTLNDPANLTLLQAYQATSANTFDFGERLFQAARFVTEMEYQHLVFEEFARKVQPAINPFEPFAFTETQINPAVKAEFAHAVYRFGHSMLTDTIARRNEDQPGPDGRSAPSDDILGSPNDMSLLDGFLNPPKYTQATPGGPSGALNARQAAGSIIMGLSDQTRQRARRVRHRHAPEQPARPSAGPADDQHDAGPLRGHPAAERVPAAGVQRDQRRPDDAVRQLDRLRGAPQAPRVAGQLRRRLRKAPDHHRCDHRRAKRNAARAIVGSGPDPWGRHASRRRRVHEQRRLRWWHRLVDDPDRSGQHRPVGRRPGRGHQRVRRPARQHVQLRVREPAHRPAER